MNKYLKALIKFIIYAIKGCANEIREATGFNGGIESRAKRRQEVKQDLRQWLYG